MRDDEPDPLDGDVQARAAKARRLRALAADYHARAAVDHLNAADLLDCELEALLLAADVEDGRFLSTTGHVPLLDYLFR